jgi:hypothetical protein
VAAGGAVADGVAPGGADGAGAAGGSDHGPLTGSADPEAPGSLQEVAAGCRGLLRGSNRLPGADEVPPGGGEGADGGPSGGGGD